VTELRHLPDDYRDRALRNHRRYLDAWVGPLRLLRPSARDDEARGAATAIHGLIDSAARVPAFVDHVDPATRAPLLRDLAAGVVERFVGG